MFQLPRYSREESIEEPRINLLGTNTFISSFIRSFVHLPIGPDLILTAAHCELSSDVLIRIILEPHSVKDNSFYAEEHFVRELRAHPGFGTPTTFSNDFMLIKLTGVTTKTPVKLHTNTSEKLTDEILTILGWGTTVQGDNVAPEFLEYQHIVAVNNSYCQEQYEPAFTITNDQLCMKNDGSCQGDSGGPLIIEGNGPFEDVQVGIVSWGIGCKSLEYPGEYINVAFTAFGTWSIIIIGPSSNPFGYSLFVKVYIPVFLKDGLGLERMVAQCLID